MKMVLAREGNPTQWNKGRSIPSRNPGKPEVSNGECFAHTWMDDPMMAPEKAVISRVEVLLDEYGVELMLYDCQQDAH